MIFTLLIAALCIIADRVSKYLVMSAMSEGERLTVINGLLNFTYIKNKGMAFGLLAEHRYIFIIASFLLLIAVIIFMAYYRKQASVFLKVACGLIIGGGVGNMIDRLSYTYVVDFIDVRLISFWKWIFNIADACINVGVFLLAIYFVVDSHKINKVKEEGLHGADNEDNPG